MYFNHKIAEKGGWTAFRVWEACLNIMHAWIFYCLRNYCCNKYKIYIFNIKKNKRQKKTLPPANMETWNIEVFSGK